MLGGPLDEIVSQILDNAFDPAIDVTMKLIVRDRVDSRDREFGSIVVDFSRLGLYAKAEGVVPFREISRVQNFMFLGKDYLAGRM